MTEKFSSAMPALGLETEMPGAPPPESQPPISRHVLETAEEGLEPRPQVAKRVIIIGGGVAGLVAAFELRRQGTIH